MKREWFPTPSKKHCSFSGRLKHMPPHHWPHSYSLCLYSLGLNLSCQVCEKLICELSSHFSILWPLNKACALWISAEVLLPAVEPEPSLNQAESLSRAKARAGAIRLHSVTPNTGTHHQVRLWPSNQQYQRHLGTC